VSLFRIHRAAGPDPSPLGGHLPSFDRAAGWLNSPPLAAADLRSKVVLVDFWTYTCINWLRTLSYVRAWAKKYEDHGLVVVGVHTPEFPFERDVKNVRWAVKGMSVKYPVALDSDYAIWDAFANRYWPAVYIADAQGRIRHHQFGEGGYEEIGQPGTYAAPDSLKLNHWALSGDWTVERRASVLNQAEGRITFRFHARDVHLVMGPRAQGTVAAFRVLVDGKPPGAAHGLDVDEQGQGTVSQQRLYQLIRQRGLIADRTFEITFLAPGVETYVFTFG